MIVARRYINKIKYDRNLFIFVRNKTVCTNDYILSYARKNKKNLLNMHKTRFQFIFISKENLGKR